MSTFATLGVTVVSSAFDPCSRSERASATSAATDASTPLPSLISAPSVLGSQVLLSEIIGERIHPLCSLLGSLVFWSFSLGICMQLPKRLPSFKQALLEGVGLGLLTACVNFLLLCGALWIWLEFFFAT